MRKPKLLFATLFLSIFMITTNLNSQEVTPGVLISDDNSLEKADESAILDVNSETKGFLPPRLNIKQRDAIEDPAEGLTIFNTTTKKLNYFDGIKWVELGNAENVDSKSILNDPKIACDADITVNNGPYCPGSTLQFYTPTVTGTNVTYRWSGPGGWTSSLQNPTRTNITESMTGFYKVVVTVTGPTSTCEAVDSTEIKIISLNIQATNTGPYCPGDNIVLSATEIAGATYIWAYQPVGSLSSWTSNSRTPIVPNASNLNVGVYNVTVTSPNGCTAVASTTVSFKREIATPYSISNTGPYCAGDTIKLNITRNPGVSYSWSGPNGWTSSTLKPTRPNATTDMAGYYVFSYYTKGGCLYKDSTNVVVNSVDVTISGTTDVCSGGTVNLSVPAGPSGTTYSWTGPNGWTSNLRNPSHANTIGFSSVTFNVTVTYPSGCTAANSINVRIRPIPSISAYNNGPYCAGESVLLNTSGTSGTSYRWSGPGNWTSTERTNFRDNATTSMSGRYYVTVTSLYGCTNSSYTDVVVNAKPAAPTLRTSVITTNQITWRWNAVSGATGYKWNTTNNYSTAIDMGTNLQHIETGLACGTTLVRYVWAYNNNCHSEPLKISSSTTKCCTGEIVKDVDGNQYTAVQIGTQCWMKSNLKTTKYKNGTNIPTSGYQLVQDNTQLTDIYGYFYKGTTVLTGNLCPTGWHVPTQDEWQILINYADGLTGVQFGDDAGKVLKDTRCQQSTHPTWNHCPSITNSTGFSALAAGKPNHSSAGAMAWFWSSSNRSDNYMGARYFKSQTNHVVGDFYPNGDFMSVRCLKD